MTIRLTIDRIRDIHSHINDPTKEEFSGYLYIRNGEVRYIDAKKSEYIDKPPITPKNLFYDCLSFHTHPKTYNFPSIQDIPSYKDFIFIKKTILNQECDGHILFTPFYIFYITINKDLIKSDNVIKNNYYNAIQVSKDPKHIKTQLAFSGIMINYEKSNGYTQDIVLKTDFVKKDVYGKNTLLCIAISIIIIFLIIFYNHNNTIQTFL